MQDNQLPFGDNPGITVPGGGEIRPIITQQFAHDVIRFEAECFIDTLMELIEKEKNNKTS